MSEDDGVLALDLAELLQDPELDRGSGESFDAMNAGAVHQDMARCLAPNPSNIDRQVDAIGTAAL